ncbi:hypothetical protein L7F22_032285 [Adiantum nelumboides]|nr:hypothetical protein [Adiantum nelumboides]
MAPRINRRTKQGSSPSPFTNPLPGIAIGVVAAVAAGFAARRALRRKRSPRSKNDEEHAGILPPVMHDGEIDMNGKNNPECTADGSIGSCYHSKLVANIDFLVDAKKDGLLSQEGRAEVEEVQEDMEKEEALYGQASGKSMNTEGNMKKEEAVEEESIEVDGEISGISVKIKATLTIDGLSGKDLQSVALATSEEEDEEEKSVIVAVEEQDTGEDGDYDRSSAGQPASPVLINGRIFEFFDELSGLKDGPDLSTGNSFSDSLSECSMQEVSSAPVKPLMLGDEAMETSWLAAKPNFVGALDQIGQDVVELGGKSSSDVEKLPEMEESLCPRVDKVGFDANESFSVSSDELDVDEKPFWTANDCNGFSSCDINEVNVEILSDKLTALEGELSVKLNGEERESARINGKALGYSGLLGDCHVLDSTSSMQSVQALNECANDDVSTKVQKKVVPEFPCINDNVVCDESSNHPCPFVGFIPVNTPSLQSAQQGACHADFNINDDMKLQSLKGVPLDIPYEVQGLVESVRDMPGIGSDSKIIAQASREDHFPVESIGSRDMLGLESVRLTDSKKALRESTSNLLAGGKVEHVEESTHKMACLESMKDPSLQCSGHDAAIIDTNEDDIPDAAHDMRGELEDSDDSLIADKVESTQEMFSLKQAGRDGDTISELTEDSIQNAVNDTAFLENANETDLEVMKELFNADPVINSEALRNVELIQLPSVDGPLEGLIGDDSVMHSGGHGNASSAVDRNDSSNNVKTKKEQTGSFLAPLEDSREGYELSPRPRAFEVENCFTSPSGRKEEKLADSGMVNSGTGIKQQEIEEIFCVDATNDSQDTAYWTSSHHTSCGITGEIDQVFTKGVLGVQSRSTFSTRVVRYLPIEIALLCSLIAFVSFLLKYLEGSLLNQQHKYGTSE